jgi:hypothetical protein
VESEAMAAIQLANQQGVCLAPNPFAKQPHVLS